MNSLGFHKFVSYGIDDELVSSGSFEILEVNLQDKHMFLEHDTWFGQIVMDQFNLDEEQMDHYRCVPEQLPQKINDFIVNCIGYYWQSGFPGCLPDGEPIGPFCDEDEALADAWMISKQEAQKLKEKF